MEKIIDVISMQEAERKIINNVEDSYVLMQKAAFGVYQNVIWNGKIAIVCGKGNNGGDGLALAKYLYENKYNVTVYLVEDSFSDTSLICYNDIKAYNIIKKYDSNTSFIDYDIIVDAIFGIGFKGDAKGEYVNIITKINNSKAYVVSIDINSCLIADTGLTKFAVKSDLTIAINNYKPGHYLNMAKDYIKELKVIDIGIKTSSNSLLIDEKFVKQYLLDRDNYSNKGNYGKVAIIGGSNNYPGAIKLANLAQNALYAGCGLAKVIVPDIISDKLYPFVLEATIDKLPSINGTLKFDEELLDKKLTGLSALAIGVGIGISDNVSQTIKYILENYSIPVVIDADGLTNLLSIGLDILNTTKCKVILTPHLKEFSRLTNSSIDYINENYLSMVSEFIKSYPNTTLLLKGPTTIVSNIDNIYYINKGCSGMAKAGSGDVLTGVITGMLGYLNNKPIIDVVATAAYINGYAGELASEKYSDISMVASDTARAVSIAINKIKKGV